MDLESYNVTVAAVAHHGCLCQTFAMNFNPPPGGDTTILNYALTLEYLERIFYMEGLANYSQGAFIANGFPDPFYANLKEIYYDE